MSASKLLTVLSNDAGLSALVSDRISLAPADQGTAKPHVSYEFESDDPVKDLQGNVALTRQDWTIYITADTYSSAEQVKAAVNTALNSESTEFRASWQSSSYNYEPDSDTHQIEVVYTLTY